MDRIVVGVDGSEASRQALLWAAAEATHHGASLEVITTYEHQLSWHGYGADESMSAAAVEAMQQEMAAATREAGERAQTLVNRMVDALDVPDATGIAVEGAHPAKTLVEHSRNADLLVVGSRGRGGFKSLMLGSVSQQCAQHAECPVVIIRSKPENQT